ncbi:hypothetical protein C0Q70_04996 [Pomacea canaliculata]|uniref:SET domain-containing protein n=1 Tax=Pomacea canaliculata TaxID=400727 RepID=A0A2T7PJX0_POMCA|nr:hypothetical protein C0Q70_04996 [Pomacea canaliculata]
MQESEAVTTTETLVVNIENVLKHSGKWEDFLESFGSQSSDFDRIHLLLNTKEVDELIVPKLIKEGKSVLKAESLRAIGNQHFKLAHYEKALECYSQAICLAPAPENDSSNSSVLALSFGNRSAAFFHLKQFTLCLQDIENALEVGFPTGSVYKLLDRKGKCCLFLKRKHEAIEAFEQAKLSLEESMGIQDKGKEDMRSLINQFIKKCQTLSDVSNTAEKVEMYVHTEIPSLPVYNSKIPCAADFVQLAMMRGEAEDCMQLGPSSKACRKAAWELYHAVECSVVKTLHEADVRLGHLAYKMVAKAGFDYLLRERENLEHPNQQDLSLLGCDQNGVYDSENYATMYHLVNHSEKRSPKDLWPRAVNAVFLLKSLMQMSFFPPYTEDEGEAQKRTHDACYIGGHILRHLQMLPCNAHEVSEMQVNIQEPSQSQTLEIGSAIYPVLSLINHSCDPSVVRHSYGDVCIVRSIRNISKGEELLDNYGALYPVMEYPVRQKHLKKQYFFDCQCEACIKNWPLYVDIPKDVINFYCERCHGCVPVPSLGQARQMESMACKECGHHQNIRGQILKVGGLEEGYQEALHKVIFGLDVSRDTLARLVQYLRVVDKHVHRPFSSHNDCQEAIKMCYAYKANAFPRLKISEQK